MKIAALFLLLAVSGSDVRAGARSPPDAAVKAVIADQVAAWNRGDVAAFCSAYAEDASFLSPSGYTHGRLAVIERYQRRYPDRATMGSLTIEPLETRVLPPAGKAETVTLAGRWTLAYANKPSVTGLTLLVFRPRGNSWEIVQDASM